MTRYGYGVSYEHWAYGKRQRHDLKLFKTEAEAHSFMKKKHRNKRNMEYRGKVGEDSWRFR